MLDFNVAVQIDFMKWIRRNAMEIFQVGHEHLDRIIRLTAKYSDLPMDLADATLVVAAEQLNIRQIISIDSDYVAYRIGDKGYFENLFAPFLRS